MVHYEEIDYPDWINASAKAAKETDQEKITEAIYLGVKDYGLEEVNKDNKEDFLYRFEIEGRESLLKIDNGTRDENGGYDYPIQNVLKEGYRYSLTVDEDIVREAEEIKEETTDYVPVVQGNPGERTLTNFLKTAMMPAGTSLYIFGGGWDWQDTGSSIQARTIGVSPDWVKFFQEQDENYTYKSKDRNEEYSDPSESFYPYGGYNEYYYAGLDCSGYLGWVLYNIFETEDGKEGFVGPSTGFARRLSDMGYGEWTQDIHAPDGRNGYEMKPGDIMSMNGHVWISLGTCDDGSVLIVHSTPAESRTGQPGGGVEISAIGSFEDCQAYLLADQYMSRYYPEWYRRYPVKLADPENYFSFEGEDAGRFSWNTDDGSTGVTDPDGLQGRNAEEVLALLFAD